MDVAPPEVRVRALARWRGAAAGARAGAAALAALALGGPEWGWRTALTVAGGVAVALVLAAFVDDPGVGGFEARRLAGSALALWPSMISRAASTGEQAGAEG